MRHLDLFSGIGGFALAARWVWAESHSVAAFCEINPHCQLILRRNWPGAIIETDIKKMKGDRYAGVDILTGGFPCQPYSLAGHRRGAEDNRALWPEMHRVIRESQPRYIVAENVPGIINQSGGVEFEQVLSDLENSGYEIIPLIIPAIGVNAPHRRERIWIVGRRHFAYADSIGRQQGNSAAVRNGAGLGFESRSGVGGRKIVPGVGNEAGSGRNPFYSQEWPSFFSEWDEANGREFERDIFGMVHGVSGRLDRVPRLRALGNAIVPQVAQQIFEAIKSCEKKH